MAVFRSALVDLLSPQSDPCLRENERTTTAIGVHRLHDATFACGIGLAFGHAEAASLEQLVEAAKDVGANGVRTAPDRTLLVIGLTQPSLSPFRDAAERLGFIVRVDDPRRHVVACVGAPICASAQIASRAIAPDIVACAGPLLDGSFEIHVSGCAKGCAHAAAATLTVVGTSEGCALIADGSARDVPFAVASASELPAAIAKHICARQQEAGHV